MAKTNYPKMNIVLPAGRYITGDHQNKRTTDMDNRPIAPDDQDYQFGVAIRKDNPQFAEFWGQVYNYAQGYYGNNPDVMARMQRGFISSKGPQGGFSWKIKDGDAPNSKGQFNEHAKGCWVVYLSTSFKVTAADTQNTPIDPATIKRGYWVDIAGSLAVNGEVGDRAGIFINPNIMRLLGFGEEIHGGMSADQAFGARPAQLPQGASATPVAAPFPQAQQTGFPPAAGPGPQQPPQYAQPTQQPYAAPPSGPQYQPQPQYVAPAGYPSSATGPQYPTPAAGPTNYPQPAPAYGAPPAAYPSSQSAPGPFPPAAGNAQYAAPQPGFGPGAPPAATMPANSYPIDPRTGQPIQPQPQFLQPPQQQQPYPPR